MRTAVIMASNSRNGVAEAKRALGLKSTTKPTVVSGGEDGLYHATFPSGDVAEITCKQHARSETIEVR